MIPCRLDRNVFKQANSAADVICVVAGHHHSGFVTSDGNVYMCGRGDGGNVWFREEKGPAGLSLPMQGFARTKPALVVVVSVRTIKRHHHHQEKEGWSVRGSTCHRPGHRAEEQSPRTCPDVPFRQDRKQKDPPRPPQELQNQ